MQKRDKAKSIQTLALEFLEHRNEFTFKKLLDRLKPGLLLFVSKYVNGNRDMCQDIVSQTFINIWEKINQYDCTYNFSTWAYAIAKNEALGQLRLSKRNLSHEQLVINQSKILKLYEVPFIMDLECLGPNNNEITEHLYELTLKEIDMLEEPYKTVMFEREINKMPLQDIAVILDWNLNTVKTRLRKARQDIADSLTKKYPELIESYYEVEE